MNRTNKNHLIVLSVVGVAAIVITRKYRNEIYRNVKSFMRLCGISGKEIVIVTNAKECSELVRRMKLHCDKYNVLGFDAEWVTVDGDRRPVSLLQLCTSEGLCGLIRLNQMHDIPQELRDILKDNTIIKTGVAPINDANLLLNDYSIRVNATYDLRFLALKFGLKPGTLGKLSKEVLDIDLDKDWRIRCSDWEADPLSDRQIDYAAKDAQCGVEIFKTLCQQNQIPSTMKSLLEVCDPYLDTDFRNKHNYSSDSSNKNSKKPEKPIKQSYGSRTYCYLLSPTGQPVCPIVKRKAEWYVQQGLGEIIQEDPLLVRLNFEPARKSIGIVDESYLNPKETKCFVCGDTERIIRKYVVPKEYRKHFPVNMKNHTFNDVFLLCARCHQTSHPFDQKLKKELEKLCDAPLKHTLTDNGGFKKVEIHKIARALLYNEEQIPESRKEVLQKQMQDFFPEREITNEFLKDLLTNKFNNEKRSNLPEHGKLVVQYFESNGGLEVLEEMCRQNFINSMNPKFLPEQHEIKSVEFKFDD